jgi:hypothetical protein
LTPNRINDLQGFDIMSKNELTHYGLNREELASRRGVHPSTLDKRLTPACGNGSFHALVSRVDSKVDCPACRAAVAHLAPLVDTFTRHYLVAALWSSTTSDGAPLDDDYSVDDIGPDFVRQAVADCADFQQAQAEPLQRMYAFYRENGNAAHPDAGTPEACAGHDFWLSRNGHGTGFWDRGAGPVGDALDKAAEIYGGVDLDEGDMK